MISYSGSVRVLEVLFEAFALALAIVATVLGVFFGAKLWRLALPVAALMFLLTYYIMVS